MSDRTILNPQYSNSLNELFSGTGSIDLGTVVANKITIDSSNTNNDYSFTSYSDALSISCPNGFIPTMQFGSGADYVQLKCPADNVLQTTALQLSDTSSSVLIKPITTNYLGLVNTANNTNTGNIQGGTFNALTSVTSPTYNVAGANGGNVDITYNSQGLYVDMPSNLYVHNACNAGTFGGGIYAGKYTTSQVLQPSEVSQFVFNIPWNPVLNWTVNTIMPLFTYVSGYPITTQAITLTANGIYELQIALTVANGSGTQPNQITSINYLIINNT